MIRGIIGGLGCTILFASLVWLVFPADRDDTDPTTGRSGMTLSTDAKTGCQYLSRPFSGMTPRMGADGRQVCGVRP